VALLDVSRVTRTLMKLVDTTVTGSSAWPAGVTLSVTALPPDKLGDGNSLSLYLYHVMEDPQFKNFPPPAGNSDVRFAPTALDLFYLLTARVEPGEADTAVLREQLMMGLAVKGLHDHPTITDATRVNGVTIMDPAIAGTEARLCVTLQPMPPSEAVSYWTAGSLPLRLAAYYQVSAVLLEPDEAPTVAGRVLQYSTQIFVSGAPHLDSSRSTVAFTPPSGTPTSLTAQPAQVPVDGDLTLVGTGLTAGTPALLVRAASWDAPIEVDAAWGVSAGVDAIYARVRATASSTPVLPGMYSAQVKITADLVLPDGSHRAVAQLSNQTPFLVCPGVSKTTFAAGVLTVDGTGFAPASATDVLIADVKLARVAASPSAGEFAVVSASQISLRLPASLPNGGFVPLRIIVNGAESAPEWVQVP
jgi:hypothetical protein